MKSVETGRHETVFEEIQNRGQKAIDAGRPGGGRWRSSQTAVEIATGTRATRT